MECELVKVWPMEESEEVTASENKENPEESEKVEKPKKSKKRKIRSFPLAFWAIEPTLEQLEAEIDAAIMLAWKAENKEQAKKWRAAVARKEKEKLAREEEEKRKMEEEQKKREAEVRKIKVKDSELTMEEKMAKFKACKQRVMEKRRLKKLEEEEKRRKEREEMLRTTVMV